MSIAVVKDIIPSALAADLDLADEMITASGSRFRLSQYEHLKDEQEGDDEDRILGKRNYRFVHGSNRTVVFLIYHTLREQYLPKLVILVEGTGEFESFHYFVRLCRGKKSAFSQLSIPELSLRVRRFLPNVPVACL